MTFTNAFVFYPRLAFANPAVGRLSAATVSEANKVSLAVTFDGAVRFFCIEIIDLISGSASYFDMFVSLTRK